LGSKITGANVLDLFAGTGSLGIESLSRNCSLVYFVDESLESIRLIEYNISILKVDGEKYKIIKSDVLKFFNFHVDLKWDIIFLDPPYRIESDIMMRLFDIISKSEFVKSDTIMIYEYFFKRDIREEINKLKVVKESHFGDKNVVYLSPC
jgi:16S rRNA (guanine966-N2)-methyltransferase